jgi:hypothetical protein
MTAAAIVAARAIVIVMVFPTATTAVPIIHTVIE